MVSKSVSRRASSKPSPLKRWRVLVMRSVCHLKIFLFLRGFSTSDDNPVQNASTAISRENIIQTRRSHVRNPHASLMHSSFARVAGIGFDRNDGSSWLRFGRRASAKVGFETEHALHGRRCFQLRPQVARPDGTRLGRDGRSPSRWMHFLPITRMFR